MRNHVGAGLIVMLMVVGLFCRSVASADSIDVPRISIQRARQMLANPDVVVIDVRTTKAWWRSTMKIANAVREDLASRQQLTQKYPKNKILIFYCG